MTLHDSITSGNCPLCGLSLRKKHFYSDRRLWKLTCGCCETYEIEDMVIHFNALSSDDKRLLSAIVRRRFEFTQQPEVITADNWRDLVSQAPNKNDVPIKVRYLLGYIAHKSSFPGEEVPLRCITDFPICFAANKDEFDFYVQHAINAGFVEKLTSTMHTERMYCLTPKGWGEVERIPTLESPYAFVAMSFSKGGSRGALLTRAFDEAIKPAIEKDAGYKEAILINREQFLGDIVYEIIARIKECRFVVADATEHKNGVYFEAGYAMGMGLQVIWTCHKDDMEKAHFDTSHLNHIVWDDDIARLRKNLANRILATIGRCPKRM